jgi:hypothetical protein
MSSVIGDTAELVRNTITAKATHEVTGSSGSFYFRLSEAPGIAKYFDSHAKVTIEGTPTVYVSGPVSATISTSVAVAVIPDKYKTFPVTESQHVQLQNSVRIQHSILVPPSTQPLRFGNETAEQLKPRTLIDFPPVVVGHYTVAGGSPSSVTIIVVELPLRVEGVAHHKTW